MSMARFMTSRWYSDQNILCVAPSAAAWWVPLRASVSERYPLICMIFTFDQARARPWRTSGSVRGPCAGRRR